MAQRATRRWRALRDEGSSPTISTRAIVMISSWACAREGLMVTRGTRRAGRERVHRLDKLWIAWVSSTIWQSALGLWRWSPLRPS